MRRLLTFTVVLILPAIAAFAQTPYPHRKPPHRNQEKAAPASPATPAAVSSPRSPLFAEPTLEQLHDALRKYRDPHDAYLSIAHLGNEESVPLLLERFRLDYGTSEPPSQAMVGFVCTQLHLVDALRSITNTDKGMYYPRWAAWWEANRSVPQHQWILNGFAEAGLHVVEPVDERFGLELIEVIGHGHDYRAFNAKRLLADVRPELRTEWVARASTSDQRFLRLGAVGILSQMDTAGHEVLLRRLAADSDLEIRREALTTLDDHLRVSLSAASTSARILYRRDKKNWITALSFAGDLLVVTFRYGEVRAFDTRTLRTLWTRRLRPGTGDRTLVAGDHLILANLEGGLLSLDQRGRVRWRREARGQDDGIRSLILRGDDIVAIRLGSVEQLDAKTGATKSTIPAADFIRDADSAQTLAFLADDWGLRSLNNGARLEHPFSHLLGVSVTHRSVCVTSGDPDNRVTCLAPDTLSPQWTRSTARHGTWGHNMAPIQDESRVFVGTDNDLTAFAVLDGSILWTTRGGQESYGLVVPTDYGLLIQNSEYKLELRDPRTGEVVRIWPQIDGVAQLAVHQQLAAVADFDGVLWLINLSAAGGRPQRTSQLSAEPLR